MPCVLVRCSPTGLFMLCTTVPKHCKLFVTAFHDLRQRFEEGWAYIGASKAVVEAVEQLGMPKQSHGQAASNKALLAGAAF
jgi:predicted hydrolase (HD superfamily)